MDNTDPLSGRFVGEDGVMLNIADAMRSTPMGVARGLWPGAQPFGAYGERSAAGAESNMVIWPNGAFSIPPSSGVQMSIVSTSTADAAAGTGIRTARIHYLDADLAVQTEDVTLNGTTPVLTVATDIRFIQCFHALTVGSGAKAAGEITASHSGTTYSQVATGTLRCSSSARMVPAGKRCLLMGAAGSSISGTSAARVEIRIVSTELYGNQYSDPMLLFPQGSICCQDGGIALAFPVPQPFSEGAVIAMTATTDKAATISGTWYAILEDAV